MMRAGSLEEWRAAVALLNVPYMNTMYADRDGNILYIYNHAIPRRSTDYDWSEPVDGADPGTEWDGYHALDELPQFLNPETGYLQNTNSSPFTATEGIEVGPDDFPPYMVGSESDNLRSQSSRHVLRELTDLTLDDFARAALTTRLLAADGLLPELFAAFESLEQEDRDRAAALADPIAALRAWDREADTASVATTLFVTLAAAASRTSGDDRWIDALGAAVERLAGDWGTWEVPWGEINRIQRPDAAGALPFSDTLPSLPVAGAPGWLGSIFVFNTEPADDGKRRYGRHGNSFVKLVEFTPEVRARSVFVFGQSGDPASPYYFDQAALYSEKRFKPAWFSAADVQANAVRTITLEVPAPVGAPGGAGTSGSPTDSCGPGDTMVSFSTEDAGVVYAMLRGSGDHAVILAHGGQFTKESWEEQARVLADSGFVTLAIDFRGRGASRGGPGGETDLDLADLDVLAAVRFLEACGVRRISIVGASFGGWAAALASTKLPPGSIDRLILLAHSPIEEPERMQGRKLFVTTKDDVRGDGAPRLPSIRDQYERAPDPKELLILDGSAHAQHVFGTDQGERLLAEIIRFLGGPPALSAPGATP
jgi:pimeloyl-ACP methyl ester carboxylesterase